jgi:hypothetical protein
MHIVPPMDEAPPREFVDFVRGHLVAAEAEASRLTGGHAHEVYPDALSDVAGHWRRLRLRAWLERRDAPDEYLWRRLATRAKQWRDEQIYEVDVRLLRPPVFHAPPPASVALRKAALLPGTVRAPLRPLAEASIAWSHAWRRARWHRIGRTAAAVALFLLALAAALPASPY